MISTVAQAPSISIHVVLMATVVEVVATMRVFVGIYNYINVSIEAGLVYYSLSVSSELAGLPYLRLPLCVNCRYSM